MTLREGIPMLWRSIASRTFEGSKFNPLGGNLPLWQPAAVQWFARKVLVVSGRSFPVGAAPGAVNAQPQSPKKIPAMTK
jgi:hypothetical protein